MKGANVMSMNFERKTKVAGHTMTANVEVYTNTAEMVNDLKTRSITDSRFDDIALRSLGNWEGVRSYQECLDYLENGYQPSVDALKESVKPTIKGDAKRIGFRNNVVGGAPVVPLAMIGIPNNMIDTYIKPIKSKVLDVYYDITCSSSTRSEDIIKAGQQILATIMRLEQQGYKFNLYAVQSYSDSNSCDILAIKVKSSNQPLDIKRMSYTLTHTSFFRVLGFDWYNKTPRGKWRPARGYNVSHEFDFDSNKMNEFMRQIFGKNAICLSGQIMMKKRASERIDYINDVITVK